MRVSGVCLGLFVTGICSAGDIPRTVSPWPLDANLGSHRALIRVVEPADAVRVRIPWRRRDVEPQAKAVIVVDAKTQKRVEKVAAIRIERHTGDIVFQPATAPGDYHVYYLPHRAPRHPMDGQSYRYLPAETTADSKWLKRHGLDGDARLESLPQARVIEIQARTEFDRFDPMEIPATPEEADALLARNPGPDALIFPEDRRHPIRMFEAIPLRWLERGPGSTFRGQARPGEYYALQLGVWAARAAIRDMTLTCSDLVGDDGRRIRGAEITCFNLEGVDWLGRPFEKVFAVPKDLVRPLWIGVPIANDAAGTYRGTIEVKPEPGRATTVPIEIEVSGETLADRGDGDLWRHARLRWLNSTLGLEDTVIAPFTPLEVEGDTVRCLGRAVTFGRHGLPSSILSAFVHSELPANRDGGGREILADPIRLVVRTADGPLEWAHGPAEVEKSNEATEVRRIESRAGPLTLSLRVAMEFDGYIGCRATLDTSAAVALEDVRLEVPVRREIAQYMLGFSMAGGARPATWDWKWKEDFSDNMVWLGDANAGLQCKLITKEGVWQWGNLKDTGLPSSWSNGSKGGARIREADDRVLLTAFSGARTLEPGAPVTFGFRFLVTPFKPIDRRHWRWRNGGAHRGGTVKHAHHSIDSNPYINYPFVRSDALRKAARFEKAEGSEWFMIYYTVRELSNYAAELWALRSLGDEIFLTGDDRVTAGVYETMGDYAPPTGRSAGGYPWLQEHLVSGYSWRWMTPLGDDPADAAIANTPLSRWHNYYIEGLAWLLRHAEIDGIYLDGIGYDRQIMKRLARIGSRLNKERWYLNFHSGNAAHKATTHRITPMSGYMEHLPYVSQLHFGEQFPNQTAEPDYYLVEMSGIPFGLTNEFRGTPHPEIPHRNMLYGASGRMHESRYDLWRFWDAFGIQDTRMLGYWDPACPVRTDHEKILATVYHAPGKALIALASWAKKDVEVKLAIDWPALGFVPNAVRLTAPSIPTMQDAATFDPADRIPVRAAGGWLLAVEER